MKNIIFIGMCGAGKTTIAKQLSKTIGYDYIDSDEEIEKKRGETFQEFIDKLGEKEAIKIEEEGLVEISKLRGTVISTGGSAVYSDKAMRYLKRDGIIIYLYLPYKIINKRLTDKYTRGIIGLKTKTLRQLYKERCLLYKIKNMQI